MLEALVFGGAVLVGVPAAVLAAVRAQRRRRRSWCAAARAAGLADVAEGSGYWSKVVLTAVHGDHPVRIEDYASGKYDRGTRVVIEGDSGLTLRAEKSVTGLERAFRPRQVELGDEAFDGELFVEGDPSVLRAVLDVETRRMLRLLVDGTFRLPGLERGLAARVEVQDGDLWVDVRSPHDTLLRERLGQVLAPAMALARRLQRPPSLVQRMAENTRTEPEWRLRLETLRLLASTYPNHSATREALRRGCEDERQEVQLQAALHLFDETGQATLLELATREWSDDPVAAKAVATLGRVLSPDRALSILAHALRTRRLRTASACVDLLAETGGAAVVDTLAKVIRLESGDVAVAAARALGKSNMPAAETPLLAALTGDTPELRLAAAQSLGRVGTPAAVLPLQEAVERDGGLRRAAREAVARIQARGSGTPGQVSLAEGAEGQVSIADDEPRGQVSLDEPTKA